MDIFALFFSDFKELEKYVFDYYGIKIGENAEEVEDSLEAVLEADANGENKLAVIKYQNWGIFLVANVMQYEEGQDFSPYSNNGELLMLLSQDTSGVLIFEYHKNGELKRRWSAVPSEEELEIENFGEPLNDTDIFKDNYDLEEDEFYEIDIWSLVELVESITNIAWEETAKQGMLYNFE